MTIPEYLEKVNTRYKAGISTEHSYRGDLQSLLETIASDVLVTNEPTRIACGAPDYIITKKGIPLGYVEAKDIGKSLDSKDYTEQFDRYRKSLPNLIITDYLEFRLFVEGNFVTSVKLAEIQGNKIVPKPENFETYTGLLKNFCSYAGQTIKSPSKLAVMMAAKARLLANTIDKALTEDETQTNNNVYESANNSLRQQLEAFKQHLIHDITAKEFADIYAQTIAYGMFAARYHDTTLVDFTRQEAAELIPKTNPFLRKLFQYVAGYDLDERIKWIVDELVSIFRAADVAAIMNNFGKATQQTDPVIHFYETFLSEYDPKLRKARGVWYTPEPVVNFIVRAVDDILKTEFGLAEGLADTSKTKIKIKEATKATADMRSQMKYVDVEKEIHKVQILDPACGTGTFLAEIVKQIYKRFDGQQGIWSQYVEDHLVPRLNGFELLMASYSMAHLKMDMLFTETGYKPKKDQRFRIYLTNSLEEHHPDTGTLFASWLSDEASEANRVKRDTPVMVIIGNPPYSGESANKGEWIMNLMDDYKKEPGGKVKLNERNPKWINDDYMKFLRYGQYYIEKNGEGILAFINPHGFLDNPTFRGMRWNLLKTYDKIYTIDLHGNSKKKETCPDGTPDENVFDIMQGVSINLLIKTGRKKPNELGKVYNYDLFGKREIKYDFLIDHTIKTVDYKELQNIEPNYFFVSKNFEEQKNYDEGFFVNELFPLNNVGIVTSKDAILINDTETELIKNVEDYYKIEINKKLFKKLSYRPFDKKIIYYDIKIIERARVKLMKHFFYGKNVGLVIASKCVGDWRYVFCTNVINEFNLTGTAGRFGAGSTFPLYIYPEITVQQSTEQTPERTPNLNTEIVNQIAEKLGLTFTPEKEQTAGTFAPIDILDYIYAVLHSPAYREKYKEFLKIDFPRVPYPDNTETFWKLVKLGGELRQLHLLESPKVNQFITTYPQDGTNEVGKIAYKDNQVWINDTQYFAGVPQVAWEFYIGGYQPAQKWLKDRKGRTLSFEDILHYQKIIVALSETARIMGEIDDVYLIENVL
ncbi:MAG TPA: N-6 DNA methylase [Bacteroidales bacterium]|nr:N-6 DNA methylase [Bacteroidales bacterium]